MRTFRNVVTVLNASLGVNERASCLCTARNQENAPVIKGMNGRTRSRDFPSVSGQIARPRPPAVIFLDLRS
jgi:hypothetical protein